MNEVESPMRKKVASNGSSRISLDPGSALKGSRNSRNSDKASMDLEKAYKSVSSKRNLCFVLLDPASFVISIEIVSELSFLILKTAILTLRSAIQEWIGKNIKSPESEDFLKILKQEYMNIKQLLDSLKPSPGRHCLRDESLKRELEE